VREIKDKEYNDSVIRILPRGKGVMDLWDKDIVFACTLSYIYEIKKKQVTIEKVRSFVSSNAGINV
jgi:hypothetical protein